MRARSIAFLSLTFFYAISSFAPIRNCRFRSGRCGDGLSTAQTRHVVASAVDDVSVATKTSVMSSTFNDNNLQRWLVQWRGEGAEGYSTSLRQWEFTSAFRAEVTSFILNNHSGTSVELNLQQYLDGIHFEFIDALQYRGPVYDGPNNDGRQSDNQSKLEPISLSQVEAYESALQYVVISNTSDPFDSIFNQPAVLTNLIRNTVERCSLVRTMLHIVAQGDSYEETANDALKNGSFDDMMENGDNANATWSIRLRRYTSESVSDMGDSQSNSTGSSKNPQYQARYGKNVRSSLQDEKNAILRMSSLVELIQGRVNLKRPDCKIYVLDGLRDCISSNDTEDKSKVLMARVLADGPKTSIYAPKTRICITTTPLCPIASFTLCNIAQILRNNRTVILDPFAGSCATLLAAAHITNGRCQSVGIEICHNGHVNRDNIRADFETRSLPPPVVLRGDCLSSDIRDQVRSKIGGGAFDTIITDPPYGIREAMVSQDTNSNNISPLTKLVQVMGSDRALGKPLLKVGGRMAAFIPVRKGESLTECIPPADILKSAGLVMEGDGKEQVLNDVLSRWLVSFICV